MSGYRKRTTTQLEKLLLRIEEQDEKIQKLEQNLQQYQQQNFAMSNLINSSSPINHLFPSAKPVVTPKPVASAKPVKPAPKPVTTAKPVASSIPVVVPKPEPVEESPSVIESEKELDDLLQAELAELTESVQPVEELSTDMSTIPSMDAGMDLLSDLSGENLKKNSL